MAVTHVVIRKHLGTVESVPSVARTSGQPGIELGVHGDDRVELELEVMDRPEHSGLRSLGAETSETTSGSHPHGIQTFR